MTNDAGFATGVHTCPRAPRSIGGALNDPKKASRLVFRAWDALRDRAVGRGIRTLRTFLDPVAYGAWYAVNWTLTRRPVTFNQKIRYKMVRDRRPLLPMLADKVAVRDRIRDALGPSALPVALQIRDSASDVRWQELPDEFVCKVSHASGGSILVTRVGDPDRPLPSYTPSGHRRFVVHPDAFDASRATELLNRWLSMPYAWSGWKREWAYRDIRPRILIEELLRGADGGIPNDFKFYVFDGTCRFIEVHQSRFEGLVVDRYTRDWEYMPFDFAGVPRSGRPQPPPRRLAEMLSMAERLGAGTDFVRIDLYDLDDRIVFGEFTHYPASGSGTFDPPEYDALIGGWWEVPSSYR